MRLVDLQCDYGTCNVIILPGCEYGTVECDLGTVQCDYGTV